MQNDLDDLTEAVNKIADTSFDSSNTSTFGSNTLAARRSGSPKAGFYRPGERAESQLDLNGHPVPIEEDIFTKYNGPPPGRTPTKVEKDGAWQLQEEYLADRLGKNEQENGKLWNTAKWIDRHYRIATTPAGAIPSFNRYVADAIIQGTDAPSGQPDDETPDAKQDNEGVEFESINVGEADSATSMKVMDEDGTSRRLEIKTDEYTILRLIDAIEDIDGQAKIDLYKLAKLAPPMLPQPDFPSDGERAESGKIIRILMMGMRTLWPPVIRAIAGHATMTSLGQGKGKGVAATVGRTRVIEGLRLAKSIRKAILRQDRPFSKWTHETRARQTQMPSVDWNRSNRFRLPSVDAVIAGTLAILADRLLPMGRDWIIKLPDNDNFCLEAATDKAA